MPEALWDQVPGLPGVDRRMASLIAAAVTVAAAVPSTVSVQDAAASDRLGANQRLGATEQQAGTRWGHVSDFTHPRNQTIPLERGFCSSGGGSS
jgi:hypothetical protein